VQRRVDQCKQAHLRSIHPDGREKRLTDLDGRPDSIDGSIQWLPDRRTAMRLQDGRYPRRLIGASTGGRTCVSANTTTQNPSRGRRATSGPTPRRRTHSMRSSRMWKSVMRSCVPQSVTSRPRVNRDGHDIGTSSVTTRSPRRSSSHQNGSQNSQSLILRAASPRSPNGGGSRRRARRAARRCRASANTPRAGARTSSNEAAAAIRYQSAGVDSRETGARQG